MKGTEISVNTFVIVTFCALFLFVIITFFLSSTQDIGISVSCELKRGYCLESGGCGEYSAVYDEECTNDICCAPQEDIDGVDFEVLDLGGGISGIRVRID